MRSMGKPINITCAGRENLQAWLALQQETTERVHPSWFPGIDTDLIVHARRLSTGRRWLANRLAQVSPLLFGMPQETETMPARKLREAQWLRTCLHDALECALDLGSLTLASTLRTLVTRSEVMRLRTVVGAERYERLLSAPPAALSLSEPPGLGIRVWWGADLRENDLLERLLRRGARELAAYAASLHPALGESVRLSFECNWWDDEGPAFLDPGTTESCLRLRREVHPGVARPGTGAQHG